MIEVYGDGKPGDLVRPILHHARDLRDVAFAVLAGLWAHQTHRDPDRLHRMHIGSGAGGWNLYLDTGQKLAFRGLVGTTNAYEAIQVRDGIKPLGQVLLEMRSAAETDHLWSLLDRLLRMP